MILHCRNQVALSLNEALRRGFKSVSYWQYVKKTKSAKVQVSLFKEKKSLCGIINL